MEKKEKKCNFAFGNQRRAPLYERQALFIRKAHQTTQVLHARMFRTLSLEGLKTVHQPLLTGIFSFQNMNNNELDRLYGGNSFI